MILFPLYTAYISYISGSLDLLYSIIKSIIKHKKIVLQKVDYEPLKNIFILSEKFYFFQ